MVIIETYGKYLTRLVENYTTYFPDTRLVTGTISIKRIKLNSIIAYVMDMQRVLCQYSQNKCQYNHCGAP